MLKQYWTHPQARQQLASCTRSVRGRGMHNCGFGGGLGVGCTYRPQSYRLRLQPSSRCILPVVRSAQATAAVVSSSADESSTPSTDVPVLESVTDTPDASSPAAAASRRRRRSAAGAADASAPSPSGSKQQAKSRAPKSKPKPKPDYQQIFQQPSVVPSSNIRRVARNQPAVIPAGAEQDASKVLAANRQAAAEAKASVQLKQLQEQVDPQLLAEFQPFAQSFQEAAKLPAQPKPAKSDTQDASEYTAAAASAQPAGKQDSKQEASAEQQQQQEQEQQRKKRPPTMRPSKRDFIELFSPNPQGLGAQQVVRLSRDTPLTPLPAAAKTGAQRLAALISSKQALRQQQQQAKTDADQPAAAAAAGEGMQQDLGTPLFGRQEGVTTIYTPAPAKGAAKSEAERQPLRLLSLRQQQQAREEARRAAVLMLRERSQREYEATLQAMLDWQPRTTNRFYIPDVPAHFPVVVQRQWGEFSGSSPGVSSSSSSSSSTSTSNTAGTSSSVDAAAAAGEQPTAAAAVRQPTPEEQQTLDRISAVMKQQLGMGLPERALRGERSIFISSLSPEAVKERLGAWVGCCGRDYVSQLMSKEPTLLGYEPKVLLNTLQAVSMIMQLSPQESVALMLKQPSLIGFNASELRERLEGLADAVGCEQAKAVRLATHTGTFIMWHPDYIQARMSALAKLLPEAAAKLPKDVVRHPYILAKSPRAVARNILQMSDTLELSSWATCRLVAGQPSIINSNYDSVKNKLERLRELTLPVRRWNRELQAMSPPALARCLTVSDAAINRLQQLSDIGAANSRRLPAINKILTMPAQYFEVLFAEVATAKERAAERRAMAAAAALQDASSSGDVDDVYPYTADLEAAAQHARGKGNQWEEKAGEALTSAQLAQQSAARALSSLRSKAASPAGAALSGTGSTTSAEKEGLMEKEEDGLLGGDASWKSSLQNAILGAAAELGKPWLGLKGGEKGQKQQQLEGDDGDQAAAAAGSSRFRRRR